ncbi:MAG: hypothetical protein C5B48_07625 [Candidatus Rokuibacteriota bacterium]|nr:MAG: hypothetical protein C5B48_07625 [Candidatus Rokubacteria bacterium]
MFAVDPGATSHLELLAVNETTLRVPWEKLKPGPLGEYIAVVDKDAEGREVFPPVDLNSREILATDGLPPSDSNPQFRQQMVYAVAMRTIKNFERGLGRVVHWAPNGGAYRRQLNLYPHYEEIANAYYNRGTGVHFGYFESTNETELPGTVVYTCLSRDVVAHQVAHALLDGLNVEFIGENPDVPALHEGFSDLVALLQHFSEVDVLRTPMRAVRGSLSEPSQLGALAPQLGAAFGVRDGIRNALGSTDEDGQWQPRLPDPALYATETEPHARGDLLVGAVFEAFKRIYESRVTDLRRIATRGTGVLPQGYLHPDLVNRFTLEGVRSARHVLDMCIRALDYMPPVQATFGDFLRAVLTADVDLAPEDDRGYRVAFADAFRSYGIGPAPEGSLRGDTGPISEFVRTLARAQSYWHIPRERRRRWRTLEAWRRALSYQLELDGAKKLGRIDLTQPYEIVTFDLRERAALTGEFALDWVFKFLQRKGDEVAGCTLLVDADTGTIRYRTDKSTGTRARTRPLVKRASTPPAPPPPQRRLRVFAFDPSLGLQLESASINEVQLAVPWERDVKGADILQPGPVGEYVEVIDHDPASGAFYEPVDLNDLAIVAQDGLPPSESNPQFHQQMVYAVAMRTIRNFEHALGRLALWSPHRTQKQGKWTEEYVQRLRIHPHALREANAYYSPDKKALLFGYFPAPVDGRAGTAPLNVFTCVSQDIVAHETTHALLDGIHRRFNEASNPDVLAFHEAFADLVALFQHFSLGDVLRHQIAETRGDLTSQNRLGELAQQFGQAIGKRGALRSAIGREPNAEDYATVLEPHDRGSILVAAVFDAFLTIYKSRIADLLRIASEGTGVLPEGQLHPDLVNRLAEEAADTAQQVLEMCIRALDYCPPVDITFGDYLRAIVTADHEVDPLDAHHHRVAFAEAFRSWGIVPDNVRTLSVDGLLWRPAADAPDENENVVIDIVKRWASDIDSWNLSNDRHQLFELMRRKRAELHNHLGSKLEANSVILSGIDPKIKFEVHSIRPSLRMDWTEQARLQWVIELTQRIPQGDTNGNDPDYYFRGGCTLLVDAEDGKVRYSIKKPLDDEERRNKQRRFLQDEANESLAATYFGDMTRDRVEPFAILHRF